MSTETSRFTCQHGSRLSGERSQVLLDSVGITVNKQIIPDDPLPPMQASGIRLGTPAATTRGMKEQDMRRIATWIVKTLANPEDTELHRQFKQESVEYCRMCPVSRILRTDVKSEE